MAATCMQLATKYDAQSSPVKFTKVQVRPASLGVWKGLVVINVLLPCHFTSQEISRYMS